MDALEALHARRSSGKLIAPAPTREQLAVIFDAAVAAPDHGKLRPWRFVVLDGVDKDAFGEVLLAGYLAACAEQGTEPDPARTAKERTKLGRAPMVIAVVAERRESAKIPWTEQRDAVAAATQNLLLACTALEFGTMWRTGDVVENPTIRQHLGLKEHDEIVAFVYVGSIPADAPMPQPKATSADSVSWWSPT